MTMEENKDIIEEQEPQAPAKETPKQEKKAEKKALKEKMLTGEILVH